MNNDIEKVIGHLKETKGIKLKDMMDKLEVDRGEFLSWRRSVNKGRREKMAEKLIEIYSEHFTEEEREETNTTQEKYVALLEKNLKSTEKERDRLKEEIAALLTKIDEIIKK